MDGDAYEGPAGDAPGFEPPAGPFDERDEELARLTRNDLGNGRRLFKRFGADLIYVEQIGKSGTWMVWDGRRFDREGGAAAARRISHATADALFAEARAAAETGIAKTPAAVESVYKWASGSGNSNRLSAMLSEARPYCQRQLGELDRGDYRITLANGTLDLPRPASPKGGSGAMLQDHDRGDLSTRLAPVDHDCNADCPKFRQFLDFVLPDIEVRNFLQRFMGTCLTGSVAAQMLLLFHGGGGNGKSAFLTIMRGVLGDYAITTDFSTLTEDSKRGGGDATPDLVRFIGVRLVTASEPRKGAVLSDATIKTQTGGERMPVRPLFNDQFEFDPTNKLILSFNDKPVIKAIDEGTWRRLALILWDIAIPAAMRRENFAAEILAREAAGVLNWMVDGYYEFREKGLSPPYAVIEATGEYRAESDIIGDFLAAWTRPDAGEEIFASVLWRAYELWCGENGRAPVTQTAFGRLLNQKRIKSRKSGRIYRIGLTLKDEGWAAVEFDAERQRRRGGGGAGGGADDGNGGGDAVK